MLAPTWREKDRPMGSGGSGNADRGSSPLCTAHRQVSEARDPPDSTVDSQSPLPTDPNPVSRERRPRPEHRAGSLSKMPESRKQRHTRASALAWLDRRINFERVMPAAATPGTFGLARVRRLLTALGNPHHQFPVVHVAGTKGKGSTVAMLAAVLQAAGHRVGRYMSPHVDTIEERICIGGRPIPAADLVSAFNDVIPTVERMDLAARRRGSSGPTWFEVLTAVAFVHFAGSRRSCRARDRPRWSPRCDECLSAGAVDHHQHQPRSHASARLDHRADHGREGRHHQARLSGHLHGDASRRPSGDREDGRPSAPLLQLGRDFEAAFVPAGESEARTDPLAAGSVAVTTADTRAEVFALAMRGGHQAINAAAVVMAARLLDARGIRVTDRALAKGLRSVSLPARIERVAERPLVILDAAHNVASMESLVATLAPVDQLVRPTVLLFAASADKQIPEMLAIARGRFDHVVITRYATNPRAATVAQLVEACRRARLPAPRVATTPAEALRVARSLATPRGLVCVAGSFFLAAEIRAVM